MNITVIEETNLAEWGNALRLFSVSPFISAPWLEAFRTRQRIPIYFRFVAENTTVGLFAGLIIEPANVMVKKLNRPLFFLGGPAVLRSDPEIAKTGIIKLVAYAASNGYTGLSIRGRDCPYVYNLDILPYRNDRAEYIIDLRGDWAEIEKKINRSNKRKLRKAAENGLTFHESRSPELVQTLSALLDETEAIRIGKGYDDYVKFSLPYFDEEVMEKLLRNQAARIFYAQKEGHMLCAAFIVAHTNRACGLLIGTKPEGYKLEVNTFVYYHVIKKLKEEGHASFNLGGIGKVLGQHELTSQKTSWGAERQECMGGASAFLQGPFYNLLHQLYARKFSVKTVLKVLGR